jgi:hypothetical protein
MEHFTNVEHQGRGRNRRSRTQSRMTLRLGLRLHQNDAAPCGSGSATLPVRLTGSQGCTGPLCHLRHPRHSHPAIDNMQKQLHYTKILFKK